MGEEIAPHYVDRLYRGMLLNKKKGNKEEDG